jgi:four helix bundle protein
LRAAELPKRATKSAIRNPKSEIPYAICEKEAAETEYWLELAVEANLAESSSTEKLLQEVRELLAIFVASGRTAKARH